MAEKRISHVKFAQFMYFSKKHGIVRTAKIKEQCLQHYPHLVIYLHNYIST